MIYICRTESQGRHILMETRTKINDNLLTVEILLNNNTAEANTTYAYYLFKDETVLEKIWYSHDTTHTFLLNEHGVYYVTIFCKQEENVITYKTEAIFYYKGGVLPILSNRRNGDDKLLQFAM